VTVAGMKSLICDPVLLEELVELDVVPVLGRAADPLAVADEQVAELALRS